MERKGEITVVGFTSRTDLLVARLMEVLAPQAHRVGASGSFYVHGVQLVVNPCGENLGGLSPGESTILDQVRLEGSFSGRPLSAEETAALTVVPWPPGTLTAYYSWRGLLVCCGPIAFTVAQSEGDAPQLVLGTTPQTTVQLFAASLR